MSDEHQQQPQAPQQPAQPPAQPQQVQPPHAQATQAQLEQAQQVQWTPVPPPHPYAAKQPGSGKGIAVTAMALGLIALLTAIVSAVYFSMFVVLAGIIGVVAVVLGIIALVKRSRPKGAGITGLAAGALAVVTALLVGSLGLVTLTLNLIGQAGSPDGAGTSEEGPTEEEWTPDEPNEVLIQWPANMASGGIVFTSGGSGPVPKSSQPLEPGTAPQPNPVDRASGSADVLIYVDYRCPHCSSFEQSNGALLEQVIADGATVEIVPLSFLDRASEGAYYSSRAAGAMACLADSQPEAAWSAHVALLSPAVQPGSGPGLSNNELLATLDAATGGLNSAAADCIATERYVTFAQALNSWVFANTVPNANDPTLRVEGTPLAVVNGEPYRGEPSDAAAFAAFFAEQTN